MQPRLRIRIVPSYAPLGPAAPTRAPTVSICAGRLQNRLGSESRQGRLRTWSKLAQRLRESDGRRPRIARNSTGRGLGRRPRPHMEGADHAERYALGRAGRSRACENRGGVRRRRRGGDDAPGSMAVRFEVLDVLRELPRPLRAVYEAGRPATASCAVPAPRGPRWRSARRATSSAARATGSDRQARHDRPCAAARGGRSAAGVGAQRRTRAAA
jgi:hypothetical protein